MDRRLAAVVAIDVADYSRLMNEDEERTHQAVKDTVKSIINPKVDQYHGRTVKLTGDGALFEFSSAVDAVTFAVEMQSSMYEWNRDVPQRSQIRYRLGINIGDIIVEPEDIYGDGVNIAARLEALAQPGCIVLSDDTYRQVRDRIEVQFNDLGEQEVKNIPHPLRVWEWNCPTAIPRRLQNLKLSALRTPSIVILPFRNLTGDLEKEYLADGLRMDIQNTLVRVSGVFIVASGSAYAFRGADSQETACTLGVQYALQGSIRQAGRKLRVSAELTDANSGRIVWCQQFDRTFDDSFDLQDEITGRVLTAMNVTLVHGEQAKVWHKTLKNARALEAFYKGVYEFYQMDRDGMQRARQLFTRVSEIAPGVAVGATWVAMTHWFDIQRGWTDEPEKSKEFARRWAETAAAMQDADGQAHSALSYLYLIDRRFDEALEAGRVAVENRPTCAYATCFYGNVLHYCGEQDDAIHYLKLAIRVQPLHPPFYLQMLALPYCAKGEFESAVLTAKQALELAPDDLPSRIVLTSAYVGLGRQDLAGATAAEIKRIDPSFSVTQFAKAQPYRESSFLDKFTSDLRSAGLPE